MRLSWSCPSTTARSFTTVFNYYYSLLLTATRCYSLLFTATYCYIATTYSLTHTYYCPEAFHDYRIKHRPCDVSWWVDGKIVHVMKECLTQPMHTSLILRTNRPGAAPTAVMEFVEFEFEPYEAAVGRRPAGPPANASLQQLLAWHAAHPD